jgi:hypothetical protein
MLSQTQNLPNLRYDGTRERQPGGTVDIWTQILSIEQLKLKGHGDGTFTSDLLQIH